MSDICKSANVVPNLDRALKILELLADNPEGLSRSEIAAKLKIPGNSAYRITMTLLAQGYLARAETTRAFCLTDKMGSLHCRAVDEFSLVERSWEIMRELRDSMQETIMLAVLSGDHGLVLESITAPGDVALTIRRGHTFDLHACSPGKVLLAFLGDRDRDRLIGGLKLKKFTANTVTALKKLNAELISVRKSGYAVDREEAMQGVKCVGVPVFDRSGICVAALVLPTFVHRLPDDKLELSAEVLKQAARRITTKL